MEATATKNRARYCALCGIENRVSINLNELPFVAVAVVALMVLDSTSIAAASHLKKKQKN